MSKKLPPYGKTLKASHETVWIFAGWHDQVFQYTPHFSPDALGIFLWEDPSNYFWPVKGRDCIVLCWLDPKDDYFTDLATTLFKQGASRVFIRNVVFSQQLNFKRS